MQRLHDILRSNALFSAFSRAYEFPDKLLREHGRKEALGFKVEADIFEAAVGGLFQDGAGEERGWIQLQAWFDVLIEPWIDWTIARLDPNLRDSYLTFNRVPLDKKSQSPLNPKGLTVPKGVRRDRKILKPSGPLTRSRSGKLKPSKQPKQPKQPKQSKQPKQPKKKLKLSKDRGLVPYVAPQTAVEKWSEPNMALVNVERPNAGPEQRRRERLAGIGQYNAMSNLPGTHVASQDMQTLARGQTRNYARLPDVRLPENQIFQPYQSPATYAIAGMAFGACYQAPQEDRPAFSLPTHPNSSPPSRPD